MSRLNRDDISRIVGGNPRAIREFERILTDVQAAISGPSTITLNYTSDGTLTTSLPALYQYTLTASDQTTFRSGVTWGVTVLSGSFVGSGPTMGGTGIGVLQLNSGLSSPTATLAVTARVNGRGYPAFSVAVAKSTAAPDVPSGGGSASDSTSTLTVFNTGSFVPITRELSITLPTGITDATLTAALIDLSIGSAAPDGTTTVEYKWQRETSPAVWSDVGTAATSSPDPIVTELVEPGSPSFFLSQQGSITCNRTETGMVAGSAQKFRLVARVSAGNVRSVVSTGTASVSS